MNGRLLGNFPQAFSHIGLVNADNFGQPGITDYRNPHVAEAMRTLRTALHYGLAGDDAKTIIVTSPAALTVSMPSAVREKCSNIDCAASRRMRSWEKSVIRRAAAARTGWSPSGP